MMRKGAYLVLMFFISLNLQAQMLKGKVTDGKEIIPFANVSVKGSSLGTAADAEGFYVLENVPSGEQQIVVSAIGYNKHKEKVSVQTGTNVYNPVLEESSYSIDQVVVTGSMKETFVQASPVKVEVITQKFLEKVATANVMEVIENVNGVQKQINCGVCGTNDIHINGMEGPYTLVLIDGMPIMSSLSTVYGLNGIPTSLIKQIEVIKGPSSTLYGTEAVAGVINIITKKPEDVALVELDAFFNSDEEKNVDFSFAPKMQKVDMLLSGNWYQMNNFIDDNEDAFTDVPFSDRLSLFNRWSVHRQSGKALDFSAKYYQEDRFGGLERWTKSELGSHSVYGEYIHTDRVELAGTYQFPFEEKLRLDASYNYHHQDSYYGDTHFEAWQEVYFANLLWDKKLGLNHDLLLGYTHRYQTYLDSTFANSDERKFIPGLFVQDEMKLRHNLSLLGGLRADHHQDHGLIYSPRFNVKWSPETYTIIRLNAGTGFRTVNLFTEDHAFLTGSREVLVSEELMPEESNNINLNIHHIFSLGPSSGTIDFDVFYTHFTNKILPDYEQDENLIVYANLDGISVSRGLAMNLQQNFEFPLSISLGGTYLEVYSMNEEGGEKEEELFAPSFSGVFSLSYRLDRLDASIDWTGKVVGPMHLPSYEAPFSRPEESPWFSLQHLQLNKTFSERVSAYVGVKNLFNYTQDSPLIDPANPFGDHFDTAYAYGPLQGRRFVFGLRLSY
jgi:outer membrane receptor for ferrienterochelin and colicins